MYYMASYLGPQDPLTDLISAEGRGVTGARAGLVAEGVRLEAVRRVDAQALAPALLVLL